MIIIITANKWEQRRI